MNKKLNQSIWSTVIIYTGIFIGFINSIFLFPKFLSTEQIGLIRQIISAVFILIPIIIFMVGQKSPYTKMIVESEEHQNRLQPIDAPSPPPSLDSIPSTKFFPISAFS